MMVMVSCMHIHGFVSFPALKAPTLVKLLLKLLGTEAKRVVILKADILAAVDAKSRAAFRVQVPRGLG